MAFNATKKSEINKVIRRFNLLEKFIPANNNLNIAESNKYK